MGQRTSIDVGGRSVGGEILKSKTEREFWNEYELEDGTTLRLKAVVTRIVRLDEYKPDGEPIYLLQSSNIVTASVPENLKLQTGVAGDKVKH